MSQKHFDTELNRYASNIRLIKAESGFSVPDRPNNEFAHHNVDLTERQNGKWLREILNVCNEPIGTVRYHTARLGLKR